jgi:hypothetical protein
MLPEEVFSMQTVSALFAALLLASGLPSVALADHHEKEAQDASPSAAAVAPENIKDGHTLAGTITQIDYQKGTVRLQTEQEALILSFPPAMVKGYQEGDRVAVHLAMTKEGQL